MKGPGDRFSEIALRSLIFFFPGFLILFALSASRSISLDETCNWWVAQGSFVSLFSDTTPYPNHLPHYLTLWFWIRIFGDSELSIRLPSLILSILSALVCLDVARLLFKIQNRSFFGLSLFAFSFFYQEQTIWISSLARQYSFGIFFVLLSVNFLLRFLASEKHHWLILTGVSATGALLCQPLFVPILPVLGIGTLILRDKGNFKPVSKVALCLVFVVIFSTLLFYKLGAFNLFGRLKTVYSFVEAPILQGTFQLFSVPTLIILLLEATLITALAILRRDRFLATVKIETENYRSLAFIAIWILTPPLLLMLSSYLLGTNFLLSRYNTLTVPAWALLCGYLLIKIGERNLIAGYAVMLIFPLLASTSASIEPVEDWRSAATLVCDKSIDETTLVLFFSGHPEALSQSWQATAELRRAWLAALTFYCRGKVNRPFVNFYFPEDRNKTFFDDFDLSGIDKIVFISREGNGKISMTAYPAIRFLSPIFISR